MEIDKIELSSYLKNHVDDFDSLINIEKFGTGQSNPTYKLKTLTSTYVLLSLIHI